MRLAFFCGSLEPGRDGVGDYARRLAGEFIRRGHACVLLGLHDTYISGMRRESQDADGPWVPTLRLPSSLPWTARASEASKWCADFGPDWASLQFVPFGFHPRGLCFGLGKTLAEINPSAPWQIMFHELWLGLGQDSKLKDRVCGRLQRRIILDFIERLQPRAVNTQAEPYRRALERVDVRARILPLFSNIPRVPGDAWAGFLEPLVAKASGKYEARKNCYLAGILGGVHPEWDAETAVGALLPLARREQKRLVLVFHGKNNLASEDFSRMKSKLLHRADVVVTGERSSAEISRILQTVDIGLATSPWEIIQKSGSAAAMLDHGLQVLVTRDDWHLRGPHAPIKELSPRLLRPKQLAAMKSLPLRDALAGNRNTVGRIAETMLKSFTPEQPAAEAVPA